MTSPPWFAAFLQEALGLLLAFGVPLSDELVRAILALAVAVLAFVVRVRVIACRRPREAAQHLV